MAKDTAAEAARVLMQAWEDGEVLAGLPGGLAPKTEAEASAISDAIMAANPHEIGGWKIGATGEGPQKALGLTQPFVGAIRAANVVENGASFPAADLNRPVIESEYAYRLKSDLPAKGAPYDRAAVEAAIGSLLIGIEMPLSRLSADSGLGALGTVADHGGTGYYIVGPEFEDWRSIDAVDTEVVLTFDGAEAGRGTGAAMMGDPVNAVVWFANHMAEKGVDLKAGQFITTGSCTGVVPAPGPIKAIADFGEAGQVAVTLA